MSGEFHILYWRDIPSLVKGKVGRQRLSRQLDDRFMIAIDAAAMKIGDTSSDEYLQGWRSSESRPFGEDPVADIDSLVKKLEDDYPRERLQGLVKNGGYDGPA